MAATTTNRPGTRAKVRYVRMSASKARVVLNLIRGKRVAEALEILEFTERLAAEPIGKLLRSAVANAQHNDDLMADELFISACFADEGPTLKRFRPRARGRAGRIHKQTCHITIEVARFTDDELDAERERVELKEQGRASRQSSKRSGGGADRARRVARSRAAEGDDTNETEDQVADDQVEDQVADETAAEDAVATEDATDEPTDDAAEAEPSDDATDEVAADDDADGDAEVKEN